MVNGAEGLDNNGLCVVSLNFGDRNTNPVEFELKGDNSEMAAEAMTILRGARQALRNAQDGPRLLPTSEAVLVRQILSEVYDGADCEWRTRVDGWLGSETWGDVVASVQETEPQLFNALNLKTLGLKRPSVWEDPASCAKLTTVRDYLIAWKQWYCDLDRSSKAWLEDLPEAASKRGLDVATAFAGLLIFDVMCVCTARCASNAGGPQVLPEEEREVPFPALAKFASKLPASSPRARHAVAQNFAAGAHALLAQEARSFAGHPTTVDNFLPPFTALDGDTAVFLRKASFAEATDISVAVAEQLEGRMGRNLPKAAGGDTPEEWQKAWSASAGRLAAVLCRCEPHVLEGARACCVSLHCAKSEGTAAFLETLRDVLIDYDADIYIVGMNANCAGKDVSAFQRRLGKLGFEIGCQPQLQQVTVAKQRTAFQTQVEKYGEIDISHKDYVISWTSPHVRRGPTAYTPDLRTAYGVDQETKQCTRLPTTLWPFDHCAVTTTFRPRFGSSSRRPRCSRGMCCSGLLVAFMVFLIILPLFGPETRKSPYGQPGSWYYTKRRVNERFGICEAAAPCREGWLPFMDSCYRRTAKHNYLNTVKACEELGATLVSIGSEAENQFATESLCPEGEFCYIGLQGDFVSDEEVWLSGEPVNYTRLVPSKKSSIPLFPMSRRATSQAAMLSNMPPEVSGCDGELSVIFQQGAWRVLYYAILPAIAMVVSGGLLILPRPAQQGFSTWLLRVAFVKNMIWYVPRVWLICWEEDFSRHRSIHGVSVMLLSTIHSTLAVLAIWLMIKRLGMLYPNRALRTSFVFFVILAIANYGNTFLFIDQTVEKLPTIPVLVQCALMFIIAILSLIIFYLISADLYRAWSFLAEEAAHGLSNQGSKHLTQGVRAAKLHFFTGLAATGSSALRMCNLLALLLVTIAEEYPVWMLTPVSFFTFLDSVTNDVCVHFLAVLDMDASVIRAKGITLEVAERASREVEQHRLAVRLLKAAPTSSEQLRELARLEGQARASLETEHERQQFLILQSAVRVETARIHRLMQCVRMRSMTMPLRYQYLIDIPVVDGAPRQYVPAQFKDDESVATSKAYFDWLYAEATSAQEVFFHQVKKLLVGFNSTPWSSDLGLVREEFPWTIWAAGPKRVATRRLAEGDDISPGEILMHRPKRNCCGLRRGASTFCVVLEVISQSHVRIHRSGSLSAEEVARDELRTCNSGAVFVPGPQKKKQRCFDKIAADYESETQWPPAASLVDICRCQILLDDPYAIAVLVAYIRRSMRVERLKNRFSADLLETRDPKELQSMFHSASASTCGHPAGGTSSCSTRSSADSQYRDVLMNVAVSTPNGVPLVCEIQLTLSNLAVLKTAEQKLYTVRRMKSPQELLKMHVFAEDPLAKG